MKNAYGSFSTFLLWVGPVGENLVLYILKTYNFLQPLALSRPGWCSYNCCCIVFLNLFVSEIFILFLSTPRRYPFLLPFLIPRSSFSLTVYMYLRMYVYIYNYKNTHVFCNSHVFGVEG